MGRFLLSLAVVGLVVSACGAVPNTSPAKPAATAQPAADAYDPGV